MSERPNDPRFPEEPPQERCEGDGYLDIVDEWGGVVGPRPCPGCPDCGFRLSEDTDHE